MDMGWDPLPWQMDEELYDEALALWGREAQMRMLTEECAELIVAINHHERGRAHVETVLREIADVRLMVHQVLRILAEEYDCSLAQINQDVDALCQQARNRLWDAIKRETLEQNGGGK